MSDPAAERDHLSYVLLGLLALTFGSTFAVQELALKDFSAGFVASARVAICALVVLPAMRLAGHRLPRTRSDWRWAGAFGCLTFTVPFFGQAWSQQFLPTNVVGLYFAAIPLVVLLLSGLFLRVPITRRKWGGFALGSFGLTLLAGGDLSGLGQAGSGLPHLALLSAVFSLGLAAIVVRLMPPQPPVPMFAAAAIVGAVAMLPVGLMNWPEGMPGAPAVGGLLMVGVVSSAFGQFLRVSIIRRRGPVFVTANGYLSAIVAAALGVLVLGEALTTETMLAFAVILVGLIISGDGSGRMANTMRAGR